MKGARINFGVPNSEYVLLVDDNSEAVSLKNQDTDTEYIGGSGSTNVIRGSFKTSDTTGNYSLALPYEGSGYPIYARITVTGGVNDPNNVSWYSTPSRYAVGEYTYSKGIMDSIPTYNPNDGDQNRGSVMYLYKSSTSDARTFSRGGGNGELVLGGQAGGGTGMLKFHNAAEMEYYITNNTAGFTGFQPDTDYDYIIIYSE